MMHALALILVSVSGVSVPLPTGGDWSWDTARPLAVRMASTGERYVADELLIGLEHASDRTACLAAVEARGAQLIGEVAALHVLRVKLPAGEDPVAVAAQYAAFTGVSYAEPNAVGEGGWQGPPNDTHYAEQWQLRNTGQSFGTVGADIAAPGAWSLEHAPQPVVLAILDTGIDFTHPEFIGRTLPGWDFVSEDGNPTADHPHGVWCAGLAAANSDNGFQVAGVDPTCTILPVKVLNSQNLGATIDLAQGILYCATQRVDVVSMSLINYPGTNTLRNALRTARNAGCILVACAGNGGIGNADISFPGASTDSISIGATTNRDERAWYSGTGGSLDFVAPGDGVITVSTSHFDFADWFGGCSAATPVAAGIVALLKAREPTLTQNKVYELLKFGAEDQVGLPSEDTPGRDTFHGWGRLNAWRSLAALYECSPPEIYGTGKTTSLGTRSVVAARGTPRESWDDFAVDLDGAIPGELAIVLYGAGRAADPWNGGTLLVRPPLTYLRPQLLDEFGRATVPIAIQSAMVGTKRCYQAWFRDPAQPDGTGVGLTNAIEVRFCP